QAPPFVPPMLPDSTRFNNVGVSAFNVIGNPIYKFRVVRPDRSVLIRTSPDPGRVLITGNATEFNVFKTPTLWNVKNTSPYFHDNSSKTLEDVALHYKRLFTLIAGVTLTDEDIQDIVAFMKLL